jgi:uncharacterized protein YbjT (DUF2867 family)
LLLFLLAVSTGGNEGSSRKEEITMKVLVIGCTGTVGSHVARGLAQQGVSVRCMTRSPDKTKGLPSGIEGCIADLDKPETLSGAFSGVDGVFLLVPVGRDETKQGLAAVAAAKSAGVKKIMYMSVNMPEGSEVIPHFASKIPIENAVKESGIAYTILKPNNFFQNDLSVKDTIMQYGLYPTPLGKIGSNRVDVRDIADCAVNALTKTWFEGRIYSLHGPDTLTGNDMARIYSKYVGRDVRYIGNDLDAWESRVRAVMPDWWVHDFRVMYKFYQDHGAIAGKTDLDTMRKLLGHAPRRFEDFVKEISGEWKAPLARAA